ncbi:hypothetical protein JCM8208_001331 [Rhodotorula glutinis]
MASLAMRHEQLSALARTKRLFWLSSCTGILSLVGVSVAVLPWHVVRRQGDWAAFAIVAASSFVWVTLPIAASGSMQLRRRVLSAWWAMFVAAAAHLALAIYLELSLVEQKDDWIENCSTSDPVMTDDACRTHSGQVVLAFPLTAAVLELGAIPLLWLLRRSFDKLPQDHVYGTLMDDDVPPGWHNPPADLAADSSASDDDDDGPSRPGAASPRRSSRTRVGSSTDKDSASDWYELGRKGHKSSRSVALSGMSWSEVRRARKERNLAKARASS